MTVPYAFGSATTSIPLSQLDANFDTPITLGNTAIQLGNTVTTLNNMTLANVTVSSGNVTVTSASLSGNLTFTGTGNRITGDFSNGTVANRVMFQTSTTNGNTVLSLLPNGTSVTTALDLYSSSSDPANSSILRFTQTSTDASIRANISGTGTYLPMTFYTGGSEHMRVATNGEILVGGTIQLLNLPGTVAVQRTDATPVISLFRNDTSVTTGNILGEIRFYGNDTTSNTPTELATVGGVSSGTHAAGDNPTDLVFQITPDGTELVAEGMRLTQAKNLKIGGTATRATTEGTNQLVMFNGTAPVGTLTNGVSFYSASGEARVMDAAGNSTLLSPHDHDTNEWIFHSKHTPTGKVLRIDVEKMLRFINDHFGLDMIQEFTEE